MSEFDSIKLLVEQKMSVNYGKISICDLSFSSGYKGKRKYQVYNEDSRNKFAENYFELSDAVDKFLELKAKSKPYVY